MTSNNSKKGLTIKFLTKPKEIMRYLQIGISIPLLPETHRTKNKP